MPPSPPPQAALDLPNNALAIVLSEALPTVEAACRLSTVDKQFRDVLYSMSETWSPNCVILPLRMTAFEADSLLKRGGGKLTTFKILWDGKPMPIEYRLATGPAWVEALQSLASNEALESIEIGVETIHFGRSAVGDGKRLREAVEASLDALCAIAGELPLSLKTISLSNLTNVTWRYASEGLKKAHVVAFQAAPCCTKGACKLDVEICANGDCRHVQTIDFCCICSEKLPCVACLENGDLEGRGDYEGDEVHHCGKCGVSRCDSRECQEALAFEFCGGWRACGRDLCANCTELPMDNCWVCNQSFCSDCGGLPTCMDCKAQGCSGDNHMQFDHCSHPDCDKMVCEGCCNKEGGTIKYCPEKYCSESFCNEHMPSHHKTCAGRPPPAWVPKKKIKTPKA